MNTNSQDTIFIGYDPGMGNQKVYGKEGGAIVPSHIALKSQNANISVANIGLKTKARPMSLTVGHTDYFVGITSHYYGEPIENTDYDRLLGSIELQVMFYAVLTQYATQYKVIFDKPIALATGLPFELCQGANAKQNANKLKKFLSGRHQWTAEGKLFDITIGKVVVTNQAAGAFFDMQLDSDGNLIPDHAHLGKDSVGVVSVGSKTTEIMLLDNLALVPNMTQGRTFGVSDLLELANSEGLYTLAMLDEKLRNKALDIQNIEPIWTRQLFGHINKVWGKNWKRAARILLVGGGAAVINGQFDHYFEGRAYRPQDPISAVSRGLYKIALTKIK